MAAAIVVNKTPRRNHRRRSVDEGFVSTLSEIQETVKVDQEFLTRLNGEWQPRRVVITKQNLYFALIGEDCIRDRIPLHEIIAIEQMDNKSDDLMKTAHKHGSLSEVSPNILSFKRTLKGNEARQNQGQDALGMQSSKNFQLRTSPYGYNSGRTYYLQFSTLVQSDSITKKLKKYVLASQKRVEDMSRFQETQLFVRQIYDSRIFQWIAALLIVVNFAITIIYAETAPFESPAEVDVLNKLDFFLVIAFTVELVINVYAHFFWPFIMNPWNIFDAVIVTVSLISLAPLGFPSRTVLLLRCLRVIRIFGKLKAVARIFAALMYSIMPMANAFFIIFVVTATYAVLGVTFYGEADPFNFGTFSRGFTALFRVIMGSVDFWFENFPAVSEDGTVNLWSSLFLVSFVILNNWVFFQVSIAVLLDNFLEASNAINEEERLKAIQQKKADKQFSNPLDPLLLRLSMDYINDSDLSKRLHELFKVLDSDGSGDLSSQEFQAAAKKLDFCPRIFMSDSDFIAITKNGAHCNAQGHLGPREFENVMREQMRQYIQSRLSSSSVFWDSSDEAFTELGTLKQILHEQFSMRAEQERLSRHIGDIMRAGGLGCFRKDGIKKEKSAGVGQYGISPDEGDESSMHRVVEQLEESIEHLRRLGRRPSLDLVQPLNMGLDGSPEEESLESVVKMLKESVSCLRKMGVSPAGGAVCLDTENISRAGSIDCSANITLARTNDPKQLLSTTQSLQTRDLQGNSVNLLQQKGRARSLTGSMVSRLQKLRTMGSKLSRTPHRGDGLDGRSGKEGSMTAPNVQTSSHEMFYQTESYPVSSSAKPDAAFEVDNPIQVTFGSGSEHPTCFPAGQAPSSAHAVGSELVLLS